jgi:hypothetical protein
MKPRLVGLDGGLMRRHRREQRLLLRTRRLGIPVEKLDAPEGSRPQYRVIDPDGYAMQFGIVDLEKLVNDIEQGTARWVPSDY